MYNLGTQMGNALLKLSVVKQLNGFEKRKNGRVMAIFQSSVKIRKFESQFLNIIKN